MNLEAADLPKVSLSRGDWTRMVIVGILVVIALARVVPDFIRVAYPLQVFRYNTNGDAVVTGAATPQPLTSPSVASSASPAPAPSARAAAAPSASASASAKPVASAPGRIARARRAIAAFQAAIRRPAPPRWSGDVLLPGDRIRIDRIKPFDRKPGIAGRGYTYDNVNRYLPIERNGKERVLHLIARPENPTVRFLDMLRILLLIVAIGLGAILFLVKPSIATAAFFVFCLAGIEAPATYLDLVFPQPWRPLPGVLSDGLRGAVRPALLLFALCLIDGDTDAPRERVFAWIAAAIAIALGSANAYAEWAMNYAALPAEYLDRIVKQSGYVVSIFTVIALAVAFVRARANDRHRIGWIASAFLFAGVARLASDQFYPAHIPLWFNSILVSMTIVPIVTIWIAVVRHQFFNVDFVVSRAVVYVALTAAVIGTITIAEELGGYIFYNSGSDIAYLLLSAVLYAIGVGTGTIRSVLDRLVDRFIFPDRHQQRQALELISGYILDAETVDDVYRALLQDAAIALKLAFGGILARKSDGSYELAESYAWPEGLEVRLAPTDELTRAIAGSRGALTFTGKDTRLIQKSFPNERLAFAAPLFYDRVVSGIVVYGHNISGLDLDPDEREHLVRVVAHASIALTSIELARYRGGSQTLPDPLPSSAT